MAVQSSVMINGYAGTWGPAESLRQGAVDLTAAPGLSFGLTNAITDQHVFEYGRTGRSLNVAVSTGTPVLGMDAATGGVVRDGATLSDITGDTVGYVVDPDTWGAGAAWVGPNDTLSTRGVAMHLLPPGWGYDFTAMAPVVGGATATGPDLAGRTYPTFATPVGAAPLLVTGGIGGDPAGAVGQRFAELAGGADARLVVLAAGNPSASLAVKQAKAFSAALQPLVDDAIDWFVLDAKTDSAKVVAALADATGILLTGTDRSAVAADLAAAPSVLAAVHARWAGGEAVLLADDAAAAALGDTYVADGISPDVEATAPDDLLADGVSFATGVGWVAGLDIQPRLLPDQNWGQLFRLAGEAPADLAIGVDVGTALLVQGGEAVVVGDSGVVVVDGREASFGTGTNGALAATWLVLDAFGAGETLAP
jgi:cyanophycinase-like exopeptidase